MSSTKMTSTTPSSTQGASLITPLPSQAMASDSPFPNGLENPVCVFCGSSPGTSDLYTLAAQAVGSALAKENIPLVYGGGRRGIMGVVSQAALKAGGHVHGVLPKALITRASERTSAPGSTGGSSTSTPPVSGSIIRSGEGIGKDLLEDDIDGRLTMQVTGSMHERKLKMAQLSTGGFVVLPGGYGTYEEMMEMITWNQLGIHRVPVLILNIGNFYTPLRGLMENAVTAGFIAPQNLSLCHIVDLPGGSAANIDASRAEEWGTATISALKSWSFDSNVGYGLNWKEAPSALAEGSEEDKASFSLFTTMRYTADESSRKVEMADVPLLTRHLTRLKEAHAHFAKHDSERWGVWPGDSSVWTSIREALEKAGKGDWRVRVVLDPGPNINVQVVPAPSGIGGASAVKRLTIAPFQLLPMPNRPEKRRPLILDSQDYDPSSESCTQKDKRLYKTTDRMVYDDAGLRGSKLFQNVDHPEVLLHTGTHLLESITSNIAIQMPSIQSSPRWVTPMLNPETLPFLDGVMRRHLIEQGVIEVEQVTVRMWDKAKREGWRVIGFNGLRGVWEAEPF